MPNIRPLSEKLQAKAIEELHEVPSRLEEDIAALRAWVEKQPHLNSRTDDQFLVGFLRGCKFSIEKAKAKLDKYYTLRTAYESRLTCRNVTDPQVKEIIGLGIQLVLPNPLGENGPRIMIMRFGPTDKYNLLEVFRITGAIRDILLHEDDNVIVSGYIQILDYSNATLAQLFQISPSEMKIFSSFAEEALPFRNGGSHCINTPSSFETAFNIFKPFIPDKMLKRFFIHGSNMEELYKHIPQKYLPKEYGGENGSIQEITDYWSKSVAEHADYFKDDLQYRTNEKLRIGKPIDFDNVFGVDGSFRTLTVD